MRRRFDPDLLAPLLLAALAFAAMRLCLPPGGALDAARAADARRAPR